MEQILKIRDNIYDFFQESEQCQKFFFKEDNRNLYAAYYTAMYLLQDSTESLIIHRQEDFSSSAHSAYLELWGILQAVIIQQDSITKLYHIITSQKYKYEEDSKWKEIRNLRNLCSGHPIACGETRKGPFNRTFLGRDFGDYNEIRLETWSEADSKIHHSKIDLGKLLDDYIIEAEKCMTKMYETMKKRKWK